MKKRGWTIINENLSNNQDFIYLPIKGLNNGCTFIGLDTRDPRYINISNDFKAKNCNVVRIELLSNYLIN